MARCEEGYFGWNCFGECPQRCSGNGKCMADGSCACDAGFYGADCSFECAGGCGEYGTCVFNGESYGAECVCDAGFFGASCSEQCPTNSAGDVCSWRGRCVPATDDGQPAYCDCEGGFSGIACEVNVQANGFMLKMPGSQPGAQIAY